MSGHGDRMAPRGGMGSEPYRGRGRGGTPPAPGTYAGMLSGTNSVPVGNRQRSLGSSPALGEGRYPSGPPTGGFNAEHGFSSDAGYRGRGRGRGRARGQFGSIFRRDTKERAIDLTMAPILGQVAMGLHRRNEMYPLRIRAPRITTRKRRLGLSQSQHRTGVPTIRTVEATRRQRRRRCRDSLHRRRLPHQAGNTTIHARKGRSGTQDGLRTALFRRTVLNPSASRGIRLKTTNRIEFALDSRTDWRLRRMTATRQPKNPALRLTRSP
ncbi:hypothetical protein C8R44DRAFT_357124 [Mycena epipterygia]|nr:hypothetical protein C8R44DRAFT_357124 [Mycena epipterygia]